MVNLTESHEWHDHAAEHNKMSAQKDIQTKHYDAQITEELQELNDQELHVLGLAHKISVVRSMSKNIDQSGESFIALRRRSPITRIISTWKREVRKPLQHDASCQSMYIPGEQGIPSGATAHEFFTETLRNIASSLFLKGPYKFNSGCADW